MHLRSQKIRQEWPLFCIFNGNDGDIPLSAVEDAVRISTQYLNEYIHLFSKPQEFTLAISEADELYWWIKTIVIAL